VLMRFIEREGHARVSSGHTEGGFALGRWVVKRRSNYREGKLSPERVQRLEALPGWSWDTSNQSWELGYQHLRRFVERHGHSQVEQSHVENGFALGRWCNKQRGRYLKRTLEPHRIERLDALPGWTWTPTRDRWEKMFSYLERYVAREGEARVPVRHREDEMPLGAWVASQRGLKNKGKLRPDRTARLEGLPGWTWHTREAQWEEGFSYLLQYVEREGHARVPDGHRENAYPLGSWVRRQRETYRRGEPQAHRVARLEALPGWIWFSSQDDAWNAGLNALQQFVSREGHARVPQAHREAGHMLGRWVNKKRGRHRLGKLRPEEVRILESVPGWTWNAKAEQPPGGQPATRRSSQSER
jgi:hypothetical protein